MHRALLDRICGSVGMRVMDQGVNRLADYFIGRKPQHGQSGRVDERNQSVFAYAENAFPGGLQKQATAFFGLLEALLIFLQSGRACCDEFLQVIPMFFQFGFRFFER